MMIVVIAWDKVVIVNDIGNSQYLLHSPTGELSLTLMVCVEVTSWVGHAKSCQKAHLC